MNDEEKLMSELALAESRDKRRVSPDTVEYHLKPYALERLAEVYPQLHMCAYYRSATPEEDALKPMEEMVAHYKRIIEPYPGWELADVYADHCASGASTKNRLAFNKMLLACQNGEYDYILTESIACFSRNLTQLVSLLRELKNLSRPVGVYFDEEDFLVPHYMRPNYEFKVPEIIKTDDAKDAAILKARRKALGLTQGEVADRAGIVLQNYQRFEKGTRRIRNASFLIAGSVLKALELDMKKYYRNEYTIEEAAQRPTKGEKKW